MGRAGCGWCAGGSGPGETVEQRAEAMAREITAGCARLALGGGACERGPGPDPGCRPCRARWWVQEKIAWGGLAGGIAQLLDERDSARLTPAQAEWVTDLVAREMAHLEDQTAYHAVAAGIRARTARRGRD